MEERERDEREVIEDAMQALFGEDDDNYEESEDDEENSSPSRQKIDQEPTELRRDLYFELVRLSEEQAETLWIAPPYDAAYITQIGVMATQARSLGLTEYEISLALRIGQFRGAKRKDDHYQQKQ